jgi:D-alanyl-D-alanine carboxypeptidase/D-alanyl-D-alanine-endopeptidase (penicillin-binding protein 4)
VQVDEIYEPLMQESDNFMAEQILLTCSNEVFDTMNTQKIIRFFTKEYLKESPDQPLWRDGSGLSRYNLFTPQTMIFLLNKIYKKIPEERIFNIFPTGKKQGTIKDWYAPFVHAKTGTLSNKHCLSGYITTRKEKTLLFSFMHNNYITSSTPLKEEMQKILNFIHTKY